MEGEGTKKMSRAMFVPKIMPQITAKPESVFTVVKSCRANYECTDFI